MYTISFCFCKVFVTQWEIPSVSYGKSCVFCFVCVRPRPRFFVASLLLLLMKRKSSFVFALFFFWCVDLPLFVTAGTTFFLSIVS